MKYAKTEKINLDRKFLLPENYSCTCGYCLSYQGTLIREDGRLYNQKEGNYYEAETENNFFHAERWVIQNLTKKDQWIIDPFGTGSAGVEAINHGRKIMSLIINSYDLAKKNILKNSNCGEEIFQDIAKIIRAESFDIRKYLIQTPKSNLIIVRPRFSTIYTKLRSQTKKIKDYASFVTTPLKLYTSYWEILADTFRVCASHLNVGGYINISVNEKGIGGEKWSKQQHIRMNDMVSDIDYMEYKGMFLLPLIPQSLQFSAYNGKLEVAKPNYQINTVWKKE